MRGTRSSRTIRWSSIERRSETSASHTVAQWDRLGADGDRRTAAVANEDHQERRGRRTVRWPARDVDHDVGSRGRLRRLVSRASYHPLAGCARHHLAAKTTPRQRRCPPRKSSEPCRPDPTTGGAGSPLASPPSCRRVAPWCGGGRLRRGTDGAERRVHRPAGPRPAAPTTRAGPSRTTPASPTTSTTPRDDRRPGVGGRRLWEYGTWSPGVFGPLTQSDGSPDPASAAPTPTTSPRSATSRPRSTSRR